MCSRYHAREKECDWLSVASAPPLRAACSRLSRSARLVTPPILDWLPGGAAGDPPRRMAVNDATDMKRSFKNQRAFPKALRLTLGTRGNALLLLASFAMVAFQMQLSAVEAKHHDIQSLVEEARKGGDVLERLTKAAGGDMEKLTPYLTDNSPDVRATVGWAIARIATASKAKITNERVVDALIAAEEGYPGYYSKLFSKIEPAVVSDEHASRLAGLVERESSSAFILAIGDLGIRQAEEALKRLAEISVTPGPAPSGEKGAERLLREKARLALAKLGHDEYLPEILGGLDPSNDHITRIEALKALGYLGRPDTAKRILELVDEPGAFEIKKSASDLVSTGIGGWALYTLQQVVSDPPTHGVDPSSFGKKDAALWKQWWQEKTTQIPRQNEVKGVGSYYRQ